MNNQVKEYRNHCVQTFLNRVGDVSAEDIATLLIKELIEATPVPSQSTNKYGITRSVAENVIRAIFLRKYDTDGKYLTTLAPNHKYKAKPTIVAPVVKAPDLELAQTLSKTDLAAYASSFNIKLNQANTKENMIIDFKEQWESL